MDDKIAAVKLISLDYLFQSFLKSQIKENCFKIAKVLLKSIGFKFFFEKDKEYVKLPDKLQDNKLRLISRCLKTLQGNIFNF